MIIRMNKSLPERRPPRVIPRRAEPLPDEELAPLPPALPPVDPWAEEPARLRSEDEWETDDTDAADDRDPEPSPDRPRNRTEAGIPSAERRRRRRLLSATEKAELPPSVVPRGQAVRIFVSTRWFSGTLASICLLMLILFYTNGAFVIREIYVSGTRYLTPPEIFQRSGLANLHIFSLDPLDVANLLKQDTTIADAQVIIGWPPTMVQISITEREPALIWEQAGQRVWVDVRGQVMALRQDLQTLVRVVVPKPSTVAHLGPCPLQGMTELLGPGNCIDPQTVLGALKFKALYPNVEEMVYDPVRGLGFQDGRGWVLWFGDGTDIDVKMAVYNRMIEEYFVKQGIQFVEVNVVNPDVPWFCAGPSCSR